MPLFDLHSIVYPLTRINSIGKSYNISAIFCIVAQRTAPASAPGRQIAPRSGFSICTKHSKKTNGS